MIETNGNLYIDGMDLYARFGCRVTRGGYDGLLALPAMKEPEANDWPEEDGIEADLSDPKLQPREISIPFVASTRTGAADLAAYLSGEGLHAFRVPSLGREWQLRLAGHPAHRCYGPSTAAFTLKLVEDRPERPTAAACDPGLPACAGGCRIDGRRLSDYGVMVCGGLDGFRKSPDAKVNLLRRIASLDGQLYDTGHLALKAKEVTFTCLLKAVSMAAFWQCRDRLLADLAAPGERLFRAEEEGKEYPCYYRKSTNWKLLTMGGPVAARFDLTLLFTSFRLYETDYFLASEDGRFILTEEGELFIDMK